jgi:hypothetical protein
MIFNRKMKNKSADGPSLLAIIFFLFFFLPASHGQVTPFQKSVLDSLEADQFNLSIAFACNISQDGTYSLTTGTDIGMMYSTRRSNYELLQSSYSNRLESFSTANRFAAMLRGSLFSHDSLGTKLIEKGFYPEPFVFFSSDANRALNYRWQFGINGVFAPRPTKIIRIKIGAGVLYELENWQMVKHEQVPYLDTLPSDVQKYIFNTIGITKDGKLFRNNFRANLYANFLCTFAKNINLNAFFDVQMPFVPPYYNLPQASVFPVVTKRYPRITVNMQLTFNIWKKLNFVTSYMLQYDKGQIPLYVPNFVYNFSQGLQLEL